jgi:hypothetical protein
MAYNSIKHVIKLNMTSKLSKLRNSTVIVLCLLSSSNALAVENEDYYNRLFCTEMGGQAEYVLPDRSRVDCLTNTHAFEADWAQGLKVYESIGQALYYSAETRRQPGILLLIKNKNSERYIRKVKRVIEAFNLPIKLVIRDVRTD